MISEVNSDRLKKQLETLAQFDSEPERPGITRIMLSDKEVEAKKYVSELMQAAGMEVHEDAAANLHGILRGSDPSLAPVWSGSHIDTVICGGRYDGSIGVLGAIEACRIIHDNNISHKRDIEVLAYTSEEPIRFGVGCIGSRALAGHLDIEYMKTLKDNDGTTLYDLLISRGFDPEDIPNIKMDTGSVFASLELHIEQADFLEKNNIPIGIVTGICAPTHMQCRVKGIQQHAGATPMTVRKDALCAAAEMILKIEELARAVGHPNAVATVGELSVTPNASNVIPGFVEFSIDIRDFIAARKEQLMGDIISAIDDIAKERGVEADCEILASDTPAISDRKIIDVLENACKERGIPYTEMISGAYHDSMFVGEFAPIGMIFVPSKNGISHAPEEFTEHEDIVRGVQILADAIAALADMAD